VETQPVHKTLGEGIPLEMFLKSNSIIQEKHPEVIERILFALGINTVVKNVQVHWESYLKFNSYLKYFSAT